jgi:hypothetical protein
MNWVPIPAEHRLQVHDRRTVHCFEIVYSHSGHGFAHLVSYPVPNFRAIGLRCIAGRVVPHSESGEQLHGGHPTFGNASNRLLAIGHEAPSIPYQFGESDTDLS